MGTTRSTTTVATAYECGGCVADLDHCHGTLVAHEDGSAECTEAGCVDVDAARHTLRIDCAELASCVCAEQDADWLSLAS